jgi:hypothetical protein
MMMWDIALLAGLSVAVWWAIGRVADGPRRLRGDPRVGQLAGAHRARRTITVRFVVVDETKEPEGRDKR